MSDKPSITITRQGPYIVKGKVPLSEDAIVPSEDGSHLQYNHVRDFDVQEEYHLCRCGHSKNKPFCDGSHKHVDWDGSETADRTPYSERVEAFDGPELELLDDNRCAYARFCHRHHEDVWNLTEGAANEDEKQQAVAGAWHCPTGRLESHDRETGKVYEQHFDPSIVVMEDPQEGVSAPLFVRGGIPLIGEDGFEYEVRNRYNGAPVTVTLDIDEGNIEIITDRFGSAAAIQPMKNGSSRAVVKVRKSPQFFGWLAGLNGHVRIASPKRIKDEYHRYLQSLIEE